MAKRNLAVAAAVLAILVGVGYSAAAWYVGKKTEAEIGNQTGALHELFPYATLDTLSYDRGIYSSDEAVLVTFATSSAGRPIGFTITSRIRHLPFSGLFRGTMASIDSTISSDGGAATGPVGIHTTLTFDGGGETVITAPDLESPQISSSHAVLKVGFTRNMASYATLGDIKKLVVTAPSGIQVRLADLHIESSQQRILPDGPPLYSGVSHLSLGRFEIGAAVSPATALVIGGMHGSQSSTFDKNNGLIDVTQKIGIQTASFGGSDWGPAEFDLSLHHLDARSLAALSQSFEAAKQRIASHALSPGEWLASNRPLFVEFLKHDPELRIDRFSFTRPDGESTLSAQFRFDGRQPADFSLPATLLGNLHATLDLKSPEQDLAMLTARQAAITGQSGNDWLAKMLQAGYFSSQNGYIVSHVEMHDRNVWLNGKLYQPPQAIPAVHAIQPPQRPAIVIPRAMASPPPVPTVEAPPSQPRRWGINRCRDSQGRTVFTDGPCPTR